MVDLLGYVDSLTSATEQICHFIVPDLIFEIEIWKLRSWAQEQWKVL